MLQQRSTLKKLQLKLHPFFLLFIGLWLLAGLPREVFILFFLVLGHELAHILTAKLLGLPLGRIELFPFGGVGYLEKPLELEQRKELPVAAAGPLFNLLLFIIFINWSHGVYTLPIVLDPGTLSFLVRANFFLACFNLLPGLPLDGGRILRAGLSARLGFFRATEVAARSGRWLGFLLFLLGLALSAYDYLNLSISLLGLFLYYAAGQEQSTNIYVFLRYLLRKEKALRHYRVLKGELLVAMESSTIMDVLKHFKPASYHQVVVLGPTLQVKAILPETRVLAVAMQQGMNVHLRDAVEHDLRSEIDSRKS